MEQPDVVVIGAGSTGSVIAARLAEDQGRSVLLIESGGIEGSLASDVGSLAPAFEPKLSKGWISNLGGGIPMELRAGRTLGGSSSVNGGYFIRPTTADLTRWEYIAGPAWGPTAMASVFERLEDDIDYGARIGHGRSGPMTIKRDLWPMHPVSEAFTEAAIATGSPLEEDKNSTSPSGVGPVPFNVRAGMRLSVAQAYLEAHLSGGGHRDNLRVMTGLTAERVLIKESRVVGVAVRSGDEEQEIRCSEVIISAGAIGSPQLLWNSGIGHPDDLNSLEVSVVVPLAGVGSNLRSHPCVDLFFQPADSLSDWPGTPAAQSTMSFMQTALHTSLDGPSGPVNVEVLATRRPYGRVTGLDNSDDLLSLRLTLTSVTSTGSVRVGSRSSDHPRIGFAYLDRAEDRAGLRSLVRFGNRLMDSDGFKPVVDKNLGPDRSCLESDGDLDGWIRARLGTAFHMTGSCAMGTSDDPTAVVDSECRVHGVEGLRVADASVVPGELSRGPAAVAVAIGERLAELM